MILFVAAEPRECRPWVERWSEVRRPDLRVHWARRGKWKNAEVLAIANGAGPERARMAVLACGRPHAVCSIGFCGALDPALRIGDIFVADEIRNGSKDYRGRVPSGPKPDAVGCMASRSVVVRAAKEKRELRAAGAAAVEMEAAGAASASLSLGVPFYCIRSVSDLAEEDLVNDFNAILTGDGRISTLRLLTGAFFSPRRLAELARLAKRTALAARNLGEFLARCDFG